jgi:hypothetical protein
VLPQSSRLRAILVVEGHIIDQREIPCGSCALTMNGDGLLRVNGEPACLKGLRLPGGVPMLYQSSLRQTLEDELVLMRKAGFTAIMADGFALSQELLTIADRLGLMVIAEIPPLSESTPELRSELHTLVEECASHPCLVAWSVSASLTPAVKVADLRALDATRLILYRDGEHSRALFPASHDEREFIDLDETAMDGGERWRELLAAGRLLEGLRAAERVNFDQVCRTATAKELLALADAGRFFGPSQRAVTALVAMRARFPSSMAAGTAAFTLGRIVFEKQQDYDRAASWFETYLREQPSGPLMGDAFGRLMEARLRAGDVTRARGTAEQYLRRFPGGPYSAEAKGILSR